MNIAYLSLGSNIGCREQWLEQCLEMLALHCGRVVKTSSVYESPAWGLTTQADFLNMVLCLETELTAEDLLTAILDIEILLERQRTEKWGERTIDIDILFFNDTCIRTAELQVPHPLLHLRRFALVPMHEIAPGHMHPSFHKTVSALLDCCPDPMQVKHYFLPANS